jgi:hypothetical protein
MKYKFTGTIQSNIDFKNSAVNIKIPNDGYILFPTAIKKSIDPKFSHKHEFQGFFEAQDDVEARDLAAEYAALFADLLSIRIKLGIGKVKVEAVSWIQSDSNMSATLFGSSDTYANLSAIESLPDSIEEIITNNFSNLISNNNQLEIVRSVMKLFNDALVNNENTGKFWNYYLIHTIVTGDRLPIDNYLKTTTVGKKLYYNDFLRKETTAVTAIRDSYSHPTTFNGKKLNLKNEVSAIIYDFQEVTRELIINKYSL